MKFCNKCGFKMNDGDRFCFNCGTPNSDVQFQAAEPVPAPVEVQYPDGDFVAPAAAGEDAVLPVSQVIEEVSDPQKPVIPESGPTMYLNQNDLDFFEKEEVTGELKPIIEEKVYAVLKLMDEGAEKEYRMKDILMNIGREIGSCELVIVSDKFVGRNHALIYTKNNNFFIVDLNSKNGTFVNGERICGLKKLEGECRLKIANTEISFKPEV